MTCKLIYVENNNKYYISQNDTFYLINNFFGHETIKDLINDYNYKNVVEAYFNLGDLYMEYTIVYEKGCDIHSFLHNLYDNLYNTVPEELL